MDEERKRQARDKLFEFLERTTDDLKVVALKSTEHLLAEFDAGNLTEDGLIILIERSQRDELLARCANDDERECVWYEFLVQELVLKSFNEFLEHGTPTSKEEIERVMAQAQIEAGYRARNLFKSQSPIK